MNNVPVPRTDEIFGSSSTESPPADMDRKRIGQYLRDLHGYDESMLESKSNEWIWQCYQDHLAQPNRYYRRQA